MSKKKIGRLALLVMFVLVLLTACRSQEKTVDLGSIENGIFKNDFFGLTLELPSEWSIQDTQTMNQAMESGKRAFSNQYSKKDLEELEYLNLLMVTRYPLGEVKVNPSFMCIAENMSKKRGIKTGTDYLLTTKKMFTDAKFSYESGEITSINLGGIDFETTEMYFSSAMGEVTIKYYVSIINEYALSFIFTYIDDETKAVTDKVVESISFKS
ncbi:hypothetical protein [Paenibacillus dendritiformis]|uniref:hypothetical protein n=1 Tax=Paenibacillus dendritiformis TaxID=130049 RepID=UPI000DA87BE8|nr:hypothetical protein [Paenibacillus dendritiformis]PZM66351.1 hypothetical protein DOE73_07270 [Paenibacillus dendritiformis]